MTFGELWKQRPRPTDEGSLADHAKRLAVWHLKAHFLPLTKWWFWLVLYPAALFLSWYFGYCPDCLK